MPYEWKVLTATLAPAQPEYEPPQLEHVLTVLESLGFDVFAIVSDPAAPGGSVFNRARVVARRRITKGKR